jgi:hypothetical protein
MRTAKFSIDVYGDQVFDGYTQGETWNGWACPFFTFEQAQRIVQAHKGFELAAWYDKEQDSFAFCFEQDRTADRDEFGSKKIEGQKLYPVGSHCWIWEEATA